MPRHFSRNKRMAEGIILRLLQRMTGSSMRWFTKQSNGVLSLCRSYRGLTTINSVCISVAERQYISVHIDHVPGFRNDLADGLSRGYDAQLLGFSESARCQIPWSALPSSFSCHTYPLELDLSGWLASA